MKATAFSTIIEKLDRGESPELALTVGDKTYLRRFEKNDRLILLGCGHVSRGVYRMARMLDFSIVAVDDRPDFANTERFPDAEVICDSFSSAIRRIGLTGQDYVCVLTRGHRWDRECVETILSGPIPYYLGMIGSHKRAEGLRQLLCEEGFPDEAVDRLHAPIGLSIGAMTTAEIAVSICGELIAERRRIRRIPLENELTQTNVNFELLRYLASGKEPCAVITVLSSTGSTPVKSGSMMAVNQIGKTVGTVGGGCGEAAALVRARRLIGSGGSDVFSIDMSNDAAAENGMVCGGEMTIWIEDVV